MAENRKPLMDSAGWRFFGIVFAVLLGPFIFTSYSISYADTSAMVRIVGGLLAAAAVAAALTTIVNAVLQSRNERVRDLARKTSKKRKHG